MGARLKTIEIFLRCGASNGLKFHLELQIEEFCDIISSQKDQAGKSNKLSEEYDARPDRFEPIRQLSGQPKNLEGNWI